jgi:hypothetical protein
VPILSPGNALADVIAETARIAPETLEADDVFGTSVGIGADQLFGGAPGAESQLGEVVWFSRDQGAWQIESSIVPAGADRFGFTLAFSEDGAGAPWIAVGQESYITQFGRIAAKMTTYLFGEEPTTTASASGSATTPDDFASAVAISSEGAVRTALSGAPRRVVTSDAVTSVSLTFDGFSYTNADEGAIVTFSGGGGSGAAGEIKSVSSSSGGINSIAITDGGSGYTINPSVVIPPPLAGGPAATGRSSRSAEVGRVTFLDLDGGGTQSLTPSGLAPNSRFGKAVAVDGDVAAVSRASGFVTLLARDGFGTWSVSETLDPPEGSGGFGSALALGGGHLLVGAPGTNGLIDEGVGSAFLYALADLSEPVLELLATTPVARELLGYRVALDDDLIALSAPGSNPGSGSFGTVVGRVLTFDLETGEELDEFSATDGTTEDYFGSAISVSGNDLAVGAPGRDDDRGAIYVFAVPVPEPAAATAAFAALAALGLLALRRRG